jgi:aspartate racemase
MKTLGLIGGMSWESTAIYYRLLNEAARDRLGGLHSAEILLWSFDFADIAARQAAGDWAGLASLMVDAARRLEQGGAAALVICTNTMHKLAPEVEAAVSIPLVHIADATAAAIRATPCRRPILLATRYTMEQDFYRGRLADRHGIEAVVPGPADRDLVHRVIYEELCRGVVRPDSKAAYLDVVARLKADGADGVIFGCTEVTMLLSPADLDVPAFDTTAIHAAAAMDLALAE